MTTLTLQSRVLAQILPSEAKQQIALITGARQTGKSTLVTAHYPHLPYFNLDAPEIRDSLRAVSSFDWAKTVGSAIIDEAQKEPLIFEKTKYAFDAGTLPFSILLGSSQVLMLQKIRESLAGRVSIYELFSLLVCELFTPAGQPIQPPLLEQVLRGQNVGAVFAELPSHIIGAQAQERQNAEQFILTWGGMPKLLHLTIEERQQWLVDYEYTYLQRDLADLAKLNDLQNFKTLQRLAALRSAQLLNFSELSRDAGISVDSVRRYLEYLKISYQNILIQPYSSNHNTSLVKTPKLFWLDMGILRHLTGFWGEVNGALYENYVVSEVYKWIKTTRKIIDLFFYRTHSGLELDLLLQTPQGHIGLEVKGRKEVYAKDVRPMQKVAAELQETWRGGMVVYRGDVLKKIAEPDIWAVPSWRLFT